MASALPKPEDRLAFADELAQVRADLTAAKKQIERNVFREYKKELKELEFETECFQRIQKGIERARV